MDLPWIAAFVVGVVLLVAGIALLAYEKLWRHRYRGPYLSIDVTTRAIDETAIQPQRPLIRQPQQGAPQVAPGSQRARTFMGRARGALRRMTGGIRAPIVSSMRRILFLPAALFACLIVAGSGAILLAGRDGSSPLPPGSVVIGLAEFSGAAQGGPSIADFSDYLLESAAAGGAGGIVLRETPKKINNPEQAEEERARLRADLLWWGEIGVDGAITASLALDPAFTAGQMRWQRFGDPDLGVLLFPPRSVIRLPAGAGTDPLVPLTLALVHTRLGDFRAAEQAATGARATLEDLGASGEIARFVEALAAFGAGANERASTILDAMDSSGTLPIEGLVNRAATRLYSGDLVGARADADRVIADREAGDIERSRGYLLRARARQAQGEFAQAVEDLDESIRLDPKYIRARLDKASALYSQSQPEAARAELELVIRKAPDAAAAFRLMGLVRLMLAQPREALLALGRAVEVYEGWIVILRQDEAQAQVTGDPSKAGASTDAIVSLNREVAAVRLYEGIAWADVARGEPPETFLGAVWRNLRGEPSTPERALAKMEEARRLDPQRSDVVLQIGRVYAQMGNTTEAVNALEEAAALDPTAPEPYFALADLYQRAGMPQEAIHALNRLVQSAPREFRGYEELHRIYNTVGDKEAADASLRTALQVVPQSAHDYLWRGKFFSLLGDNAQAEAELRTASGDPMLWEAHLHLGQIYAQSARGPEALAAFQLVLESRPNHPDALLGAGRQLALAGQTSEADKLFNRLTTLSPGNLDGHIAYLQLLLTIAQVDKAISEGRKAVATDDGRADAHFFLAEALEAKKEWSEASKEYITATKRDPTLFEAFIRLARTLLNEDKYIESIEASRSAMNLRPTDPQSYRWKAEAELALSDGRSALASAATAIELRSGYADALAVASRAASVTGDPNGSIEYASQAIRAEPRNLAGHLALGEAHLVQGRGAEAVAAYQSALQISPAHAPALVAMGRAENANGQREEALRLYRDALEADPLSAEAHLFAGLTYVELGRWEDGFRAFRSATELRPRWPTALYNLGRAYLQRKDLANAHGAFTRATEYSPNYVEAWFYLGLSNRERGRPEEAISAFHKAAQLNGGYAEAWLYLGLTLEETGERLQAAEAFRQARDTAGDAALRAQAEQGLLRVQ